ncbi:MAG TPA: hypothetical protein DEB74_12520 [Lachnospiraceae bacterium]|nr:hypothetical protein [Lachnospiraceae bacterium]
MKKVMRLLLIALVCCGMLVGCGNSDDSNIKQENMAEEDYNPTENEFGEKFNPEEFEDDGIKFSNLEISSTSEKVVFRGTLQNISNEEKEFQFAFTAYNRAGEECPFFYGRKFSEYNYKLKPSESMEFSEEIENKDNSKGPYEKFTMMGVYGAQVTAETKTAEGVQSAKSLSEYQIQERTKEILTGYETLSLDVLTLTEGGYSVSVQIIVDADGEDALSICKEVGNKIAEFNPSYDVSVVSSSYQRIAEYDSIGNEIIN